MEYITGTKIEPVNGTREKCEMKVDRTEFPGLFKAVSRLRTAYKELMMLSQEESLVVTCHALVMMANMGETKVPERDSNGDVVMTFDGVGHRKTLYHDPETKYELGSGNKESIYMVSLPNGTKCLNRIEGKYYSKLQ